MQAFTVPGAGGDAATLRGESSRRRRPHPTEIVRLSRLIATGCADTRALVRIVA
jgi:hypothetical protein